MISKVIKLKLQCCYTCLCTRYMSKTPRSICDTPWSQNISSHLIWDFYLKLYTDMLDLARTETRGQGHSDLETVGDSQGPRCIYIQSMELLP